MLCCSYFVLDVVLGCPADCHYCILQDVLSNLPVTINADIQGILDELAGFLATRKNVFTRIGTGELSDSLMLDGITHFAERAVPFFAGQPHAVLELKTKGSSVDVLAQLEGRGRTIVSMSLAPQVLIDRYENGTALLGKRIEAASRCVSWGYPVGFHFDPIILENGWEEAYAGVVDRLRGEVDPSRVAWVSMGAFRFTGKLARIIRERFPTSGLLAGEFERCGDGKFRYPEAFRSSAYRVIYEALRSWSDEFPVYLCMESPSVWETVTGSTPPPARSLSALLDDRARHLALSNRAK